MKCQTFPLKCILNSLFVAFLVFLVNEPLTDCHPAPSVLCHGFPIGSRFYYKYSTKTSLNNNDHKGKEPVGFGYENIFVVENVWQNDNNYIIKVVFDGSKSGKFITRGGEDRGELSNEIENEYPLFAHIVDHKEKDEVKAFYVHIRDTTTKSNLKKAVVSLLRTKKPQEIPSVVYSKNGQDLKKYFSKSNSDSANSGTQAVLLPEIVEEWESKSKLGRDHSYVLESGGWHNVSLVSRIYSNAHSKLHSTYQLILLKEDHSVDSYASLKSVENVIEKLGNDYLRQQPTLNREKKICHNCMTLANLVKEYEDFLDDRKIATIPATIAYLKVLDRVRSGGPGSSRSDILQLLNDHKKSKTRSILMPLLDILSGALTEQSIGAALDHLNLPKNEDLDLTERFLTTLGASYLTLSQSGLKSSDASHEFITRELIKISMTENWSSQKLKWSTLITLGTILRSHNSLIGGQEAFDDEINRDVMKHLNSELRSCEGTDCKVSMLYAIGNTGNLKLSVNVLEKYVLSTREKRESVAAIRAIKECLNYNQSMDNKLLNKVKSLVAKVVFDPKHETTARIIAAEIIAHHLNDKILTNSLLRGVPNFDNFEMTTMMWTKALKAVKLEEPPSVNNWLLHSTIFNGTSDSFKNSMGGTNTMNVTYGLTMELLNKGKLLKESTFDVELHGSNTKSQHLITVNLFARGLESFAGGDTSTTSLPEGESTMAGMSLRVFGVQLRPYVFFSGTGELMGHVWSGTASEPTTVFRGNLLVSDISDGHPLINGFVVEQNLRGVLSLHLSGEVQISLWNRNSHSVVKTGGALLVQGSQTILTSETTTSVSQQFSFGGHSSIDFVTDLDFYSTPFKMCMQITQPEFILRHNTRKYESVNSAKVDRRIHRRNFVIPAKSLALHRDNNEMCSIMQAS